LDSTRRKNLAGKAKLRDLAKVYDAVVAEEAKDMAVKARAECMGKVACVNRLVKTKTLNGRISRLNGDLEG